MSLETRSSQGGRPSRWAVSLLMFSIAAAMAAMGLLGADMGLL
jgi:hypothetical protein